MPLLTDTRRVVLAFWSLWYSAIVATNGTDLLKRWGLLPADFAWVSNNHAAFTGASPGAPAEALYLGGYAWECATAILLWRALLGPADPRRARLAFTVALAFWGVFILLSEVTIFNSPSLYLQLFTTLLISAVAVEHLPRGAAHRGTPSTPTT